MARSKKKGVYVHPQIIEQVKAGQTRIITKSRGSVIIKPFVGLTFSVYNGMKYNDFRVTSEDFIGHKLGEFVHTRTPSRKPRETAKMDKKAKAKKK